MRNGSNMLWGLLLIAVGVLFLLDRYDTVDAWHFVSTYWPAVLVVVGIRIIWEAARSPRQPVIGAPAESGPGFVRTASAGAAADGDPREELFETNILGDVTLAATSDRFRGGSVNTVFGDTTLDLGKAGLHSGEQRLKVSGVFGDVRISVPADVPIRVTGNTLVGDVRVREYRKSGIGQSISYQSENYTDAGKKLHIAVSQVFGDVEIY